MWWTKRAVGLHVTVLVLVPGFLALGYWQLRRALSGNELSWAYTVEWPIFTVYALFMWWRLVHEAAEDRARRAHEGPDAEAPATSAPRRHRPRRPVPVSTRESAELEAYNAYLAALRDDDPKAGEIRRPPRHESPGDDRPLRERRR